MTFFTDQSNLLRCHSEKRLQYRNLDFTRLDRMNISTSCAILVTLRPETSEFTLLTIAPFVDIWQKIGISRQISQNVLDLP